MEEKADSFRGAQPGSRRDGGHARGRGEICQEELVRCASIWVRGNPFPWVRTGDTQIKVVDLGLARNPWLAAWLERL